MSYEPIEDVYKILQKNNIDSINVWISTKEEIIIAYNDSTLTATNLICESKHKIKAKWMQISKDNIDTDNIFMLKVDVEWNELDTLFAISDNILKITEYIFIECSGPGRSNNWDATEVISYLHKKWFSIVRFFSFSYDLSWEMIVWDILFRNKLSNN